MQTLTQGQFRAIAQNAIGKLGKNETIKTGEQELKDLITAVKDDYISVMFLLINENNDNLPLGHKCQIIKLFGLLSEVLGELFLPHLPRAIAVLTKKLKDSDENMQEAISTAFGQLALNLLYKIDTTEAQCKQLSAMLKPLFLNLQASNKLIQRGSALCINKIIQHSPVECLKFNLQHICEHILHQLQTPTCKCSSQSIDCLLSLIVSVEQDFVPYIQTTLDVVNKMINSDE